MNNIQETKQSKSKNTEKIRKPPPEGKEYDSHGRMVFKKGYSGNPEGKPEGAFSLIAILKAELQKCPEGQDKHTYADLIIKRMLKEAIEKGDQAQIRLIWNYIEGMPPQKFLGDENNPFLVKILHADGREDNQITPVSG